MKMHFNITAWIFHFSLISASAFAAHAETAKASCERFSVAIDVGHNITSPGATSARGKKEYDFNLRFAMELIKESASRSGLSLIMLKNAKSSSLSARGKAAMASGADAFISIHHDSVNPRYLKTWKHNSAIRRYFDGFSGYSVFVSKRSSQFERSLILARQLGLRLRATGRVPTLHHAEDLPNENRELLDKDRGIYEAPFVVLYASDLPAILFEVGIIVNREEELLLEDPQYRSTMQKALLDALEDFCGLDAGIAGRSRAPPRPPQKLPE